MFENRSTFGKVMGKSRVSYFFDSRSTIKVLSYSTKFTTQTAGLRPSVAARLRSKISVQTFHSESATSAEAACMHITLAISLCQFPVFAHVG